MIRLTKFKMSFWAGLALIMCGLVLMAFELFSTLEAQKTSAQPVIMPSAAPVEDGTPVISGTPIQIQIPSLGIDIKVEPGYFNEKSQTWNLSLTNAHYATMTAPANDKGGLTFIYGHFRKGVFYRLPKIQPGAEAIITTDNEHVFTYIYQDNQTVDPTETSWLAYKGSPKLVLQTCTGLWYQKRQLFNFTLSKVE